MMARLAASANVGRHSHRCHFVHPQAQGVQPDEAMRITMVVIDGTFLKSHQIRVI